EWLQTFAYPPVRSFECRPDPPLDVPGGHFDLVYAVSAFTHIGANWASWLAEIHRVLAPEGIFVATLLGQHTRPQAPVDDDAFGILVRLHGCPATAGGPVVFHSRWWLKAHWGRAFEITALRENALLAGRQADGQEHRHSVLVATRRPGKVTAEALAAPEPNEPRELRALSTALEHAQA